MKVFNATTAHIHYFYLNYGIYLAEASECIGGRYDQWKSSRVCETTCENPRERTCYNVSILIILSKLKFSPKLTLFDSYFLYSCYRINEAVAVAQISLLEDLTANVLHRMPVN